ncbi:MAG: hypothetical protein CMD19_07450 [Flavobacteriales bacterium]|jgi:hypothetical protein|nr:hypothetical protein [Flavobacteriales bacterium]MAX06240.1 hypothetical protein [Flavobacteriales bacterium]|tara:strand:- start:2599 stop:3237 length:639 start_codon:yes stop_codon:yes gene_type:complete
MKAKTIALILIPLNLILFYFVYNSINSQVKFNEEAGIRITENVQKLKDLRQLQVKYKQTKGAFADNFDNLIYFLENDSMPIIKATGETPDSLINGVQMSDELALELGLIARDTAYVSAKETVFDATYMNNRKNDFPLNIDKLKTIPYSNSTYNIDAGQVEKGNVIVQVFEISTDYRTVFTGLDAENKSYDLDALLKVGSMTEASLNGNWKSE